MAAKQRIVSVTSMTWASYVNRVGCGPRKAEGVETAQVSLATEQATVRFDPAHVTVPDCVVTNVLRMRRGRFERRTRRASHEGQLAAQV